MKIVLTLQTHLHGIFQDLSPGHDLQIPDQAYQHQLTLKIDSHFYRLNWKILAKIINLTTNLIVTVGLTVTKKSSQIISINAQMQMPKTPIKV